MYKLAAISPRTQSLTVNQGPTSPEQQQFESLFSERAHAVLGAKSPDLANSIVTFKVLESNVEQDTASGLFICIVGGLELHVPIVLAAGSVQTPEVFYSPRTGRFLPLSSAYIRFAEKAGESQEMGSPVEKSKVEGLGTPSLQGITSPPQSMGKFASFEIPLLAASVTNASREKVSNYLADNPKVLKVLVSFHGKSVIEGLSTRTKEASYKQSNSSPGYRILTSDSPYEDFKEVFGERYKLAYMQTLNEGYSAADYRKEAAELVRDNVSSSLKVVEPGTTGVYKLLKNDGKHVKSLVIVRPKNIGRSVASKYLCLLENGDYILCDKITAIETNEDLTEGSVLSSRILGDKSSHKPGTVTYVKAHDGRVVNGTMPERVVGFTKHKGSPLTCRIQDADLTISFLDSAGSFNTPTRASDSDIAFVPISYRPLNLKSEVSVDSFITGADSLRRVLSEGLSKTASSKVRIKRSVGGVVVNGKFHENDASAVEKLASLGCSVVASKRALSSVLNDGTSVEFYVIPRTGLTKIGSIFGAPAPGQAPSVPQAAAAAPLPPGMMPPPPPPGMMPPPPGMMPPPPPPPPPPGMMPPPGMDPSMGMTGPGGIPTEHAQMVETAAETGNQEVLDSALASVLINESGMEDLMSEHSPKLLSGLDSLCRILLTLQINFPVISEQIGPEEYSKFSKKLSRTIKSLGDLVLSIVNNKSTSGGIDNASISDY